METPWLNKAMKKISVANMNCCQPSPSEITGAKIKCKENDEQREFDISRQGKVKGDKKKLCGIQTSNRNNSLCNLRSVYAILPRESSMQATLRRTPIPGC